MSEAPKNPAMAAPPAGKPAVLPVAKSGAPPAANPAVAAAAAKPNAPASANPAAPATAAPASNVDAWLEAEKPEEPEEKGPSGQMLRAMAAINPALKGGDSTAKFIANAKGALGGDKKADVHGGAVASAGNALDLVQDVDHLIDLAGKRFENEKRELETQFSLLQVRIAGLKDRHLNEMMTRLAELDANLSSVVTQEAMKAQKKVLDLLGFTPTKFVQWLRSKRK